MADSDHNNDRPARQLSEPLLGARLFALDLGRKLRERKTLILLLIQLLPALVTLLALFFSDVDGLQAFEGTVQGVYLPFLVPLAALFFGGPTIVDEVEGRTITYLTLRPLSRTTMLAAKLTTSVVLTVATSVISVVAFYLVCTLGSPAGITEGLDLFGAATAAVAVGAITYTTIFALLGVVFASTLLPGIVYYVVFELIIGAIPIVELLSVKFHLHTLGGFDRAGTEEGLRQTLERFLLDQPLQFDWWIGLLACGVITGAAAFIAAVIFRNRQFHV